MEGQRGGQGGEVGVGDGGEGYREKEQHCVNYTFKKKPFCLPSLFFLYLRAVCDGLEYILHSS